MVDHRGVAQPGSAPHWGCGGRWFKSSRPDQYFIFALLLLCSSGAVSAAERLLSEERAACDNYQPLRQPFFGDLHVHTAFSLDAATQDTRNRPEDAYRFAKGERLGIQPYDANGRPLRSLQLKRPLDFVTVTDHAEMLGEVSICSTPGKKGYYAWPCLLFRWFPRAAFFVMNERASNQDRPRFGFCGDGDRRCLAAAAERWQQIQDAAEDAYDRSSACSFTSFIGYEWTGDRLSNLHRNVIFRNAEVPSLPVSFYEESTPEGLWRSLASRCTEAGGRCDVLAIPHNSNLSAGRMFSTPEDTPLSAAAAALEAHWEPLLEIMQHKGDSECWFGPGQDEDELCAFEKLPYNSFRGKFFTTEPSVPRPGDGFARRILAEGLRYEAASGQNPYRKGFIGSTDTHLGTPGAVAEEDHQGHGGAGKVSSEKQLNELPDDLESNPGGLAVVWAEENTRDALFAAFRRRETYGTSGPRLRVRFFGGWEYPEDLCAAPDFAARGYAGGVPMGGVLPASPAVLTAPRFAVQAFRDPGTAERSGMLLQRVQIIKGWVDEKGMPRQRVYEVAGEPNSAARVDTATCEVSGPGFDQLCAVWRDPDFDVSQGAFYYARAVENPRCRWSQYVCNARGVDCQRPQTIGKGLEGCCAAEHRGVIQERAWTSPVWYQPAGPGAEGQ